MATKFIGQRKWVQQVLVRFSELEEGLPEPFARQPEWPDWVYELLCRLLNYSHPGTRLKSMKNWKARELGRFLGRQYAGEFLLQGKVLIPQPLKLDKKNFGVWTKLLLMQQDNQFDQKQFEAQIAARSKVWKPHFQKFIQETLASACERPYVEAREFFDAFGRAMVIKPEELRAEDTLDVGEQICWTMVLMWPDIQKFKSISQLHQAFERALKPRGIVVKYKRIEKLCQRIGLKFQAGGGRPKGSKNSDKSPRSLGVITHS